MILFYFRWWRPPFQEKQQQQQHHGDSTAPLLDRMSSKELSKCVKTTIVLNNLSNSKLWPFYTYFLPRYHGNRNSPRTFTRKYIFNWVNFPASYVSFPGVHNVPNCHQTCSSGWSWCRTWRWKLSAAPWPDHTESYGRRDENLSHWDFSCFCYTTWFCNIFYNRDLINRVIVC